MKDKTTNILPHTPNIWRCTKCDHIDNEKPNPNVCPTCGAPMYRTLAIVVVS